MWRPIAIFIVIASPLYVVFCIINGVYAFYKAVSLMWLQSFQWDVQVPGEGGKWHAWLEAKNCVQSYSTPAIASTCLSWLVSMLFLLCFNWFTLNWCTRKLGFFGRIIRRPGACLEIEIIKSTMAGTRAWGRPCTAWQDNVRTWTGYHSGSNDGKWRTVHRRRVLSLMQPILKLSSMFEGKAKYVLPECVRKLTILGGYISLVKKC